MQGIFHPIIYCDSQNVSQGCGEKDSLATDDGDSAYSLGAGPQCRHDRIMASSTYVLFDVPLSFEVSFS
jgi:hypothetical protein